MLEREGRGLNLTEPVRDGILNHTGSGRPATLEGRVVRLVDRVAYINHDIDDAVRAGILDEADLPAAEIELLGPTGAARIDTLVRDIVATSRERGDVAQSDEVGGAMLRLRKFMFERVYLGAEARSEHDRVIRTLRGLFDHYLDEPALVADGAVEGDDLQRVTDYIAGMTDRFAIATLQAPGAARGVAPVSRFRQESVERVKEATDIVEVISALHGPAARRDEVLGAVPVSRRAHAVVLGRSAREALPLLRLRGRGRRDPLRRGEGGALVRRRGRGAGGSLRGRARARAGGSAGGGAAQEARAARRAARADGGLLRHLPARRAAGGEGARVPGGPRAGRGGPGGVRGRLRARHLGHGADPRPAGRLLGRGDRGRGAGSQEPEGQGALRPLPLADRVPDPRRARAGAGVRSAGAASRPEAEVRQLARVASSIASAARCTGSTAPARRSRRRAGRWWWRATRTCSPATRPGSATRSR